MGTSHTFYLEVSSSNNYKMRINKISEKSILNSEEDTSLIEDEAIHQGSFKTVEKLISQSPIYNKAQLVNESRTRLDEDDRRWFVETPLFVASTQGYSKIVQLLLTEGADPTLECSPIDGVSETPLSATKNSLKYLEKSLRAIISEKHYIYDNDTWKETSEIISKLSEKYNALKKCIKMLKIAEDHWTVSEYCSARFSVKRLKANVIGGFPNKPILKNIFHWRLEIAGLKSYKMPYSVKEMTRAYNRILLEKRCEVLGRSTRTKPRQNIFRMLSELEARKKRAKSKIVSNESNIYIPKRYRA